MKRFVSYLYSIYNNQKIHNAGFARIELRTGRSRIDIHLKENGYSGRTGTVYLFIKKKENIQGISIGDITFRNNQADFRYEQPEENIGQTSLKILQMQGILIQIDEQTVFLSQWDEEPIDISRFEIWQEESEEEIKKEISNRNNTEENISNRLNKKENVENGFQNRSIQDTKNILQRDSGEHTENSLQKDKGEYTENSFQRDSGEYTENSLQGDGRTYAENSLQGDGRAYTENSFQRSSMHPETGMENAENSGQTFPAAESSSGENLMESSMEEDCSASEESMQAENKEDGQTSDLQTAELQPQMQKRDGRWEQTWRYMLRSYPVLQQFEEKQDVLCVRIEIKDVRLLPEKYWSMINNSFLLHGFFNYRYLAFGRIGLSWFVGIPGIYQNQEHVMASIFGFPDFLPQKEKNEKGGQPGYWYRILDI